MHKFIPAFVFLWLFALVKFAACSSARNETVPKQYAALDNEIENFRDIRDGQVYKMVTIDDQVWMARNLNYEMAGSYCYKNNASNCMRYGRLYTWGAAMNACPDGWHLPTYDELVSLISVVGGRSVAGKMLKSTDGWIYNGNGSDDYGFSALPAGTMFIDSYGTRYKSEGFGVYFWSSTRYDKNDAFSMSLHDERDGGNLLGMNKKAGLNVRCVKDY